MAWRPTEEPGIENLVGSITTTASELGHNKNVDYRTNLRINHPKEAELADTNTLNHNILKTTNAET
jgi:hypothetical protein